MEELREGSVEHLPEVGQGTGARPKYHHGSHTSTVTEPTISGAGLPMDP